nr:MAG TPA: hypothetical protein [Caudoviricetes sp.]
MCGLFVAVCVVPAQIVQCHAQCIRQLDGVCNSTLISLFNVFDGADGDICQGGQFRHRISLLFSDFS